MSFQMVYYKVGVEQINCSRILLVLSFPDWFRNLVVILKIFKVVKGNTSDNIPKVLLEPVLENHRS